MRARKDKVIETLTGGLAQLAKRRKVKVVHCPGTYSSIHKRCSSKAATRPPTMSERLTFDHCILATGSVPAMPKMFDIGSDRVMDSTGALQAG